jgi:hypothetical protein
MHLLETRTQNTHKLTPCWGKFPVSVRESVALREATFGMVPFTDPIARGESAKKETKERAEKRAPNSSRMQTHLIYMNLGEGAITSFNGTVGRGPFSLFARNQRTTTLFPSFSRVERFYSLNSSLGLFDWYRFNPHVEYHVK